MAGLLCPQARASVTVLVGEPFGSFGGMMPQGHVGIYLDRVCADTPTHLRLCHPGEMGIVLARYHKVSDIDWLAIPVLPFLYGADTPEEVPRFITPAREAEIRERYRLRYLRDIVPNGPNGTPAPKDEWVETIGVTYDRKVWGYRLETTLEQDQRLIDTLNDKPNLRAYKLRTANCADFAANMVNILYPGLIHRDKVADFGLMTPKQVARSVASYGKEHPEANLTVAEVPQIPGTLARSHPIRGVAETGLKSKRYLFSLSVLQPEVIAGCAIVYLDRGRWQVGKGATRVSAELWLPRGSMSVAGANSPAGTGTQGSGTSESSVTGGTNSTRSSGSSFQ
jgi:hypothetical protein